ncbi:MAG: DUF3122 domain-containing protein [Oscillatoriophycideae cyanobacterium NC_groundwater_1537_Pr4_S-0.65um_50_18]|nr:DUF3122 domain-containing protein [Oscillatoriophycideae cyanobacterium NC_groundwater_1537_Pr4_S-0.65um_50_18]
MSSPRKFGVSPSLKSSGLTRSVAIASLLFVWVTVFWVTALLGTALPATASLLRTADAGTIVVQSRRTLRDQNRQSWQAIAFKRVQPDLSDQPLYLRLVAFPDSVAIDHPQPILLSNIQGQVWTAADRSDQIAAFPQPSVGQYELQAVLPNLSDQPLRLEVPTVNGEAIVLRIPIALIQEWRVVAQSQVSQLTQDCGQFPLEARQNPDFPEWTGCRGQLGM